MQALRQKSTYLEGIRVVFNIPLFYVLEEIHMQHLPCCLDVWGTCTHYSVLLVNIIRAHNNVNSHSGMFSCHLLQLSCCSCIEGIPNISRYYERICWPHHKCKLDCSQTYLQEFTLNVFAIAGRHAFNRNFLY